MAVAVDQFDHLDVSLRDFEPSSPLSGPPFEYPSNRSGFLESDRADSESMRGSVSAGGYSPPAWRRLGNGDRSSGFWRKSDNILGPPLVGDSEYDDDDDDDDSGNEGDEAVLAQAIRTRLPTGSLSPEKERSPEPEFDPTIRIDDPLASPIGLKEMQDNCRPPFFIYNFFFLFIFSLLDNTAKEG